MTTTQKKSLEFIALLGGVGLLFWLFQIEEAKATGGSASSDASGVQTFTSAQPWLYDNVTADTIGSMAPPADVNPTEAPGITIPGLSGIVIPNFDPPYIGTAGQYNISGGPGDDCNCLAY